MKKALIGSLVAGAFLAYACGAEQLYREDTDIVLTIQGEGSDFSQYTTYYLPDSVIELCLQPESGTPTSEAIGGAAGGSAIDPSRCDIVDHASDEAILDAFAEHFDSLGYERVDDPEGADVALLVGWISRVNWNLSRPYCYPNYYFGGCVPGSSHEILLPTDSLLVQLVDLERSSDDVLVPAWTVAIHQTQAIGKELATSMGGGPSSTKERIWLSALEQAFTQSPYLEEGGD